jgi:integrase
MARGHVPRSVAALATTPTQHTRKHSAPNVADIERLLDAMRGERLEPLLIVALGTGLRRQELLGLTCDRIVFDGPNPELRVDKRVARAGGQLAARHGAKSDAGQRRVPLVPIVLDALRRRRTRRLRNGFELARCVQPAWAADRRRWSGVRLGIDRLTRAENLPVSFSCRWWRGS